MVTEEIRKGFSEIQKNRQRISVSTEDKRSEDIALINYVTDILNGNADDDMISCFCLWNISDRYALMRKCEQIYANHFKFAERLFGMEKKYLFWCVSDGTQKLTLELGGHADFWWDNYKNAVAENKDLTENEYIAGTAHRAAMVSHPSLNQNRDNFKFARDCFADFIKGTRDSEMNTFYKIIYASQCMELFGETELDTLQLYEALLPQLKCDDIPAKYVVGEWEFLNCLWSPGKQAVVGINAYVNALIRAGKSQNAKEVYLHAKGCGLPDNAYINRRIG